MKFLTRDTLAISMLAVVMLISMVDLMLAVWLLDPAEGFHIQERNPIVVKLVSLTRDFRYFIPLKIIGTFISCGAAYSLYKKRHKLGFPVCVGLFCFQVVLLRYLCFGHLL